MIFNKTKIGIEIRENEIRMVLLEKGQATQLEVFEIPSESLFDRHVQLEFIRSSAQSFYEKTEKRAKELFCILSGNEIDTRFASVPTVDNTQIQQMLKWESERYVGEALDSSLWNYIVVEQSASESKIFLSKIEKNTAEQYEQLFSDMNLNFIGFTSIPLGLFNLFTKHIKKSQCNAVVYLNTHEANIVIIHEGKLRFCRQTRCDLNDDMSEILSKIDQSFAYFGAEERLAISDVTVIGPESPAKELVSYINNSGKTGVYFNISKHLSVETKHDKAFAASTAFAADEKQFIVSAKRKRTPTADNFMFKAAAALAAIIVVMYTYQQIQLKHIEREFASINIQRSEITPYVKEFESYTQLKQKYSDIENSIVALLKNKTNWHILLEKLGSLTPQGVWVRSLNTTRTGATNYPMNTPGSVLQITGQAFSYEDVLDFKNNLSESRSFDEIVLQNTSSSIVDKRTVINFRITFRSVNLL